MGGIKRGVYAVDWHHVPRWCRKRESKRHGGGSRRRITAAHITAAHITALARKRANRAADKSPVQRSGLGWPRA
jgi:hypothetical protein